MPCKEVDSSSSFFFYGCFRTSALVSNTTPPCSLVDLSQDHLQKKIKNDHVEHLVG